MRICDNCWGIDTHRISLLDKDAVPDRAQESTYTKWVDLCASCKNHLLSGRFEGLVQRRQENQALGDAFQ